MFILAEYSLCLYTYTFAHLHQALPRAVNYHRSWLQIYKKNEYRQSKMFVFRRLFVTLPTKQRNLANNNENRIAWIDWCKVLTMVFVIFCHLPQQYNLINFFGHYFLLSALFFISGYLHKVQPDIKTALRKYWTTLIIPYLIFQVVFYPYWLAQQLFHFGQPLTDPWISFLKPVLLSLVGVPLNGIMYYVVILLFCKLFTDICLQNKYRLTIACITSFVFILIAAWIHYQQRVVITYPIDHLFDNLQFFLMGYFAKEWGFCKQRREDRNKYALYALLSLTAALLICYFEPFIFWVMRVNYEIVSVLGILFIVNLSRCLFHTPDFIVTLSKGMFIPFGIHWMFIGPLNLVLEHFLHVPHPIFYPIPVAAVIAVIIMTCCLFRGSILPKTL